MINTRRRAPVSTATLPLLMEAVADPRATSHSVASAVSTDAGLASRVIALANSAQFGLSRRVGDLDVAVSLLGMSMVQTLALADAAALMDRSGAMAHSQRHSLETATAAWQLAGIAGVRPSDAFAAGLLHDIGELLLLQDQPTKYAELQANVTDHAHQLRLEKEAFGTDHALLGAEHLLEWRVPDLVVDAVADHHEPHPSSDPLTVVVAAADELVCRASQPECPRDHALRLLGLDAEAVDALYERAHTAATDLQQLLAT